MGGLTIADLEAIDGLLADRISKEPGGCWLWQLGTDRHGYGRVRRAGRDWLIHRYVWTITIGEIPDGLTVDHICFAKTCVNPDHLQLLTPEENSSRKWSKLANICRRGHALTPDNVCQWGQGRRCKTCRRAAEARRQQRDREALARAG